MAEILWLVGCVVVLIGLWLGGTRVRQHMQRSLEDRDLANDSALFPRTQWLGTVLFGSASILGAFIIRIFDSSPSILQIISLGSVILIQAGAGVLMVFSKSL